MEPKNAADEVSPLDYKFSVYAQIYDQAILQSRYRNQKHLQAPTPLRQQTLLAVDGTDRRDIKHCRKQSLILQVCEKTEREKYLLAVT